MYGILDEFIQINVSRIWRNFDFILYRNVSNNESKITYLLNRYLTQQTSKILRLIDLIYNILVKNSF
jgi:hypothetical protein